MLHKHNILNKIRLPIKRQHFEKLLKIRQNMTSGILDLSELLYKGICVPDLKKISHKTTSLQYEYIHTITGQLTHISYKCFVGPRKDCGCQ